MANTIIPLSPPTFPPGYCYPATPQQLFNDAVNNGAETIIPPTAFGVILATTAPPPSLRSELWGKVDANNNLIRIFSFSSQYNQWVALHPLPPSDSVNTADAGERRIYVGTLTGLESYDGGDGTANSNIGDTTGPMWQQDTIWSDGTNGYFPVGIPITGGLATTNPGGQHLVNTTTGTGVLGITGCYFIKRTARLYYVG